MGSTGARKGLYIKDDYGRNVKVVTEVPKNKDIWPSGSFGRDGEYYAVFGTINGYSVDPNSLEGIRVSLEDLSGITGIAGWQSWKSSAQADAYVNRYDKPGASKYVQRRVERSKAFSKAMKKLGL